MHNLHKEVYHILVQLTGSLIRDPPKEQKNSKKKKTETGGEVEV